MDGSVVLSSLTRRRIEVELNSDLLKLGEALLLIKPEVQFTNGKMGFTLKKETDILHLGMAVDFGICSYVDSVSAHFNCLDAIKRD